MITERDLLRLRSGELTFDAFARDTRADFLRLAHKLSLTLPPWMDVEDLAHEMLLSVPNTLQVWRPGDYKLKGFVVFRACAKARRVASKARGSQPPEVDVEDEPSVPEALQEPAAQHDRMELDEHLQEVMRTLPRTELQRRVLSALARWQSMDGAAKELIKHPATRVMFAADPDLVRMKIRQVMTRMLATARQSGG